MTYQGQRARPIASEARRVFAVSEVRIDADGRVSDVLWTEVGGPPDQEAGARALAPVADVVDALRDGAQVLAVFPASKGKLPDRALVVVEYEDGMESIAFDHMLPPLGQDLADMTQLDD